MEIIDYLMGRGGFALLALFAVVIVLYNKIKARKAFRVPSKKKNT
ncbi:hypothetical protein [uncultured Aquimarina sp.]|nr:hypothetical protein [uncultured Aquimarina sp.]